MATTRRDDSNTARRRHPKATRDRTSSRVRRGKRVSPVSGTSDAARAQLLQGVQQVWLAGMGAIARAQKEGPAAFQDAVIEGLRLLERSRSTAQAIVRDAFGGAQETLQSRMGGALDHAQETWDNIEALFQSRVQRALQQIGVPNAEEIRVLTQRVAELNASVRKLDGRQRVRKTARKASKPRTKRKSATRGNRVTRTTGGASR